MTCVWTGSRIAGVHAGHMFDLLLAGEELPTPRFLVDRYHSMNKLLIMIKTNLKASMPFPAEQSSMLVNIQWFAQFAGFPGDPLSEGTPPPTPYQLVLQPLSSQGQRIDGLAPCLWCRARRPRRQGGAATYEHDHDRAHHGYGAAGNVAA